MNPKALIHMTRELTATLICVLLALFPSATLAQQANVYECVRYVEKENGLVVDIDCISKGLASGADPNWIKRDGNFQESTLTHYVQLIGLSSRDQKTRSEGIKAVQALIDGGARLQPEDASILFWAISGGNTALVKLLLSLGASPTSWPMRENGNATPIEAAAERGHQEIVEILVTHGASRPNSKDALQAQFVRTAIFGTPQKLARFLSKGVNINGKTRNEETALVNSISQIGGLSDCEALANIRWLLANGADVNLPGKGGYGVVPPLHAAVWATGFSWQLSKPTDCSLQSLREIIKKGAHVAGKDTFGQTPLHVASETNNLYATRLLLEAGSKVMPLDNRGKTPLDIAESGEIIKLLKKYGATER
jgi:ankyrin repeat protein